ncbi:RecX family transcriptional regulator [Candidatus Daviesbacteria bacterium]|nr:RecX family transcriptional regulator [Candidatus Daviesbacteria bacterium]
MSRITSVEPQKKNPHRFNIYLDGQFAFGADEDTVVSRRLVVGKEIAKEDLDKILFETEVGKLMERMYRLFNIRQRSEKEIRDYLKVLNFKRKLMEKEEISPLVIDATVKTLKKKNLINDQAFAKAWMEARMQSKKKGKKAIKAELYQKGIDREIIEDTLEEESIDESKIAQQALYKKAKLWKGLPKLEFKKKAIEFLLRRGFDYQAIKEVVDSYLKIG